MSALAISPEVLRLRERLAEAEETIRQLRELGRRETTLLFTGLHLTKREAVLVATLMQSRIVSRLDLWRILQQTSQKNEVCPEAVSILIHRVRRRLKDVGVEVKNEWGRGYYISDQHKQILESLA